MQLIIRSRAPVRISFAGGGTDVSPYTEKFGGAVVNAAINRYAYATFISRNDNKIVLDSSDLGIRLEFNDISEIKLKGELKLIKAVILYFKKNHPDFFADHSKGFEIYTSCEIPPRSGLGSSAAMFASVIGIFNKLGKEYRIDNYEVAELAYFLEREELKNSGGRQDQYASTFGGINFIEFKGNDFVKVSPLGLNENYTLELESNLLLLDLGPRTDSGDIIDDQIKNLSKDKKAIDATHKTKELSKLIKYALIRGDFQNFGELLDMGWQEKKKFSKKISNEKIDRTYNTMREMGALGGKVLGAGGGGHILFYTQPGKKPYLIKEAEKLGLKNVPFVFDHKGLTVWSTEYKKNISNDKSNKTATAREYSGTKIYFR